MKSLWVFALQSSAIVALSLKKKKKKAQKNLQGLNFLSYNQAKRNGAPKDSDNSEAHASNIVFILLFLGQASPYHALTGQFTARLDDHSQ